MVANNPLLNFHFQVEWGGQRLGFTQVEGLNAEANVALYREGNEREFHARRIPTTIRYDDVVLTRGMIGGDNDIYELFRTVEQMRTERRDVIIQLLNDQHEPVVIWQLKNAFIRRMEGPVLSGTGANGGITIERMTLTHEGLSVQSDTG